jgi:hypothetical protein
MFLPLLFIVTAGCFFLFVLATLFLPVEDHTDEPRFASDNIIKDYKHLHGLIEGAATDEELSFLTDMALDFELDHKGRADVKEYFTDLMETIHRRDLQIQKYSKKLIHAV